jgi:RNA polymerase sigma factor (TIGR02999 family)
MSETDHAEITDILFRWKNGDDDAKESLLPIVYIELKRQAGILMSRERDDHTLQPTALVHEAFLKLDRQAPVDWQNRNHFYGILTRLMRQILIDHARKYTTSKRRGKPINFAIEDLNVPVEERAESIVALNEALEQLEQVSARQAKIVEMKFFGGMEVADIAAALDISERTVGREWQAARLWLYRQLING